MKKDCEIFPVSLLKHYDIEDVFNFQLHLWNL